MKAKRSEKEVEWDEQKDVCAFGAFQYLAKIYLNRRTKVFQQLTHQWIIAFCPFGERARARKRIKATHTFGGRKINEILLRSNECAPKKSTKHNNNNNNNNNMEEKNRPFCNVVQKPPPTFGCSYSFHHRMPHFHLFSLSAAFCYFILFAF